MATGKLDVFVEDALQIKDTSILGKGSPYCTLTVGRQVFSSPPIPEGGTHPYFNAKFEFKLDRSTDHLLVQIFSKKTLTDDDLLGYCSIFFEDAFFHGHVVPLKPYALTCLSGRPGGEIRLSLTFKAMNPVVAARHMWPHLNASNLCPCELQEVVLIGNHNDVEDTLVFHFLDGQGMAKVVGVGLDYGQVILRNGLEVEIHEVLKSQWEKAWLDSKSTKNLMYKTLKVSIPFVDDIGTEEPCCSMVDGNSSTVLLSPLLWDVARFFTLSKTPVAVLNNSAREGGAVRQSRINGRGSGSSSNVSESLIFNAESESQFVKRGGGKENEEDGDGDGTNRNRILLTNDDDQESRTKVKLFLLGAGYSFTNADHQSLDTVISDRLKDLEISWVLDFEFSKSVRQRKICLTATVSFALRDSKNSLINLGDRFGPFHDFFSVSFAIANRGKGFIDGEVIPHDCQVVKNFTEAATARESKKGKQHAANGAGSVGIHGIATLQVGGGTTFSTSEGTTGTSKTCNEFYSLQTSGGFNVWQTGCSRTMALDYFAPIKIRAPEIWEDMVYKADIAKILCKEQTVKFSGTWLPTSYEGTNDVDLVEYKVKSYRRLREINKTEVAASNASSSLSSKLMRKLKLQSESTAKLRKVQPAVEFKDEFYIQKYQKKVYLNHSMTHLINRECSLREIQGEQGSYLATVGHPKPVRDSLVRLSVE